MQRIRTGLITALLAVIVIAAGKNPVRAAATPAAVKVQWVANPLHTNEWHVEVTGLPGASLQSLREARWDTAYWQHLLPVNVEQGSIIRDAAMPSMLGHYQVTSSSILFEPDFPFERAIKYRATFWPGLLPDKAGIDTAPIIAHFEPPAIHSPRTVITEVYPSAATVPENLLKFYIHFSAPMQRGHIYDHLHLRDEQGKFVELPFLELDEELWNPAMTRLTLFIDPGRIKRGVTPLEEVGPALEMGKRFTLVVDRDWNDANGQPLEKSFEKSYAVGPPDREPPDPAGWTIQTPRADSKDVLTVIFSEPMDHALAERVIHVTGEAGQIVAGKTELRNHEQQWLFAPGNPWKAGQYRLLVQTTIEDLAGNNIGKKFEVDLFEGIQRRFTNSTVSLPFEIKKH